MNTALIVGRLTRDPELRYTAAGTAVTHVSIAVDRPPRRGADGQPSPKQADFIDVTVWGAQAESVANYCHKGRRVGVEGRIEVRSYDDSQGVRRKGFCVVARSVQFLDWPRDHAEAEDPSEGAFEADEAAGKAAEEEDVPF